MVVALIAPLASCSGGSPGKRASSPVTTVPAATTTSSSSTSSSTTTVPAPTTAATSAPTTTPPRALPAEGAAKALYDAWTRTDRAAAAKVAQPQAVADLFARPWHPGDGWAFVDCSGAAGSIICTWQRPAGQLLLRVQNVAAGAPGTVSDVRFQP